MIRAIEKGKYMASWAVENGAVHETGRGDCVAILGAGYEQYAQIVASAPELLDALRELQRELRSVVKMDVRKHYHLMVADACATKAIDKAEGQAVRS